MSRQGEENGLSSLVSCVSSCTRPCLAKVSLQYCINFTFVPGIQGCWGFECIFAFFQVANGLQATMSWPPALVHRASWAKADSHERASHSLALSLAKFWILAAFLQIMLAPPSLSFMPRPYYLKTLLTRKLPQLAISSFISGAPRSLLDGLVGCAQGLLV